MLANILLFVLKSVINSTVELGLPSKGINLEDPPDRLISSRLEDLFNSCLYSDSINCLWSNKQQITKFLESDAPYIAIVRDGFYEGLLRSDYGHREIIGKLFSNLKSEQDGCCIICTPPLSRKINLFLFLEVFCIAFCYIKIPTNCSVEHSYTSRV
jgi:hypothetical protein